MDDIRAELESVRNILIKNKITMFIDVKCVVHNIFFEEKFLKDIYTIISSNILLKNPSSSLLYKSFLTTLCHIVNDHNIRKIQSELLCKIDNDERDIFTITIDIINENVSEMFHQLKEKRRCHFELYKLLDNIELIVKSNSYSELQEIYEIYNRKVSIYLYNSRFCENDHKKMKYYLNEMKSIFSYAKKLNNELKFKFINGYINLLMVMFEEDKLLIRSNASRLLSRITWSNYVWWIIRNYIYTKSNQISENKTCIDKSGNTALPNKIGILLYGYSGTALSVLCGFRDVIISEVINNIVYQRNSLKDRQSVVKFLFNSNNINVFEKEISNFFEIFVCECQPKNIYENGKLRYHDGYEYISSLKRRNFTNITLIADECNICKISSL